jgi:hypothetical protein
MINSKERYYTIHFISTPRYTTREEVETAAKAVVKTVKNLQSAGAENQNAVGGEVVDADKVRAQLWSLFL